MGGSDIASMRFFPILPQIPRSGVPDRDHGASAIRELVKALCGLTIGG
jgi:hypothetical protein